MEPGTHIIGRQSLKLRYRGNSTVPALRRMLSQVCTENLPAGLSSLLDKYDRPGFVQRIERLQVRVSIKEDEALETSLARAILEQTEAALVRELAQIDHEAMPQQTGVVAALLFYLERGYLPWWQGGADRATFLEELAAAWEPVHLRNSARELVLLLRSPDVQSRLLGLISYDQLAILAGGAGIWPPEDWARINELVRTLRATAGATKMDGATFDRLAGTVVLDAIARAAAPDWVKDKLQALLRRAGVASPDEDPKRPAIKLNEEGRLPGNDIEPQIKEATPIAPVEGEAIYVGNAGLVLFSAYLPALFRNVGLLKEGALINPARAIALLRYLVFAEGGFEEFDVMLEKVICGLPLAAAIADRPELNADGMEEAEGLLESVVAHWTALKGTSPAGLREGFLQREGRLSFVGGQWELKVQRKGQDVLLDYLPWSFSMIRHPWMNELLIVKWNNT